MSLILENQIMEIKMFGHLHITYQGKTLTSDDIHSEMAELLLVYIITHHTRELAMSDICEQLWDDGGSDNPIGALKNLMYRLRATLKKVWGDEFILTGRGSYQWNPDIELLIDTEKLNSIVLRLSEHRIDYQYLEEGIELYKSVFLPKYRKQHWIILLAAHYQSQYASIVEKLSEIYLYQKEYQKLEFLCNESLKFDKYDESIHYLLLYSFMRQGKKQLAVDHYHTTSKMLLDELGISISQRLKDLYVELLGKQNDIEMDLSIIQVDLKESLHPKGTFICEYGVFKEIYRLQERQSLRLGMSIYCALLSVNVLHDIPVTSDTYKKMMKNTMDTLHTIISETLRVGDCASRYSVSQYVLLIPTCTYETAVMVMERVLKKYYDIDNKKRVELTWEVRDLTSHEEEAYDSSI